MIITVLYNEHNGCDYHRLLLPAKHFNLQEGDSVVFVKHDYAKKNHYVYDCDVLFYSRIMFEDWEIIDKLKAKYDFKLVVDIDDHYTLPYNHLIYKGWKEHKIGERILQSCANADHVFVTNNTLYNAYKQYNTTITVIPNALPFDEEPFVAHKEPSDKLRFIYTSGVTHYNDLKTISGLFQRLNSDGDFKKNATFTLCGHNNPKNNPNNAWIKMEAICKSPNYIRRNTLPLDTYITHYNYGDISIAPLENTQFNNGKSNLKFVEAACMHHPFICSNTLPYSEDNSKGAIYCQNTKDWYKGFKFFLNNRNAVEDYGNINYEYAKQRYDLKEINKIRLDIFNALLT